MEEKIPLIVVAGPTASGKTRLAVELAKIYNGEVVSADSMQIYKGMDIVTAKPTAEEMQDIPHYMIDFLYPEESFSVADYVKMANGVILDIFNRGKIPILCGGTGLYISSLVNNVTFDDTGKDEKIRSKYEGQAKEFGNHYLWEKLNAIDPGTAQNVHENNLPRVIRGLEVYELTGTKLSEHKEKSRLNESPYKSCIIGIGFEDRQVLYNRINVRVDQMIDNGLIEEAQCSYENNNMATANQAIGYKELIPFFENKSSLNECIEKIKQETRRYAKRQLTWFRRMDNINWVYYDKYCEYKNFLENVQNIIAKSKIM
ncbi:MAG: tRNA (adenosine(37)-N6)-dimethylallyltransferase MiaA [Oscillospiraceae bacterium]